MSSNFNCSYMARSSLTYVRAFSVKFFLTSKNFYRLGRHFQNGHHNAAQIPHCLISTSWIDSRHRKISTGLHFQNGHHNTTKIQHCSISKVAFDLFFKPVVSDQFGRLHNREIIIISCFSSDFDVFFCNKFLRKIPFRKIISNIM